MGASVAANGALIACAPVNVHLRFATSSCAGVRTDTQLACTTSYRAWNHEMLQRAPVQVWLYEQTSMRIEGRIVVRLGSSFFALLKRSCLCAEREEAFGEGGFRHSAVIWTHAAQT